MAQTPTHQAFNLALQHHQAGRLYEAEQLCRQILAQQPNHADALHLLGVIANQVGRNDIAVDLFGRAIALKPNWPEAYSNLGVVFRCVGRQTESLDCYRRALALSPNDANAHNGLGILWAEMGRLDEAIASFERSLAINPQNANAHNNMGTAWHNNGEFAKAVACYRRAVTLDPNSAQHHSNLGESLSAMGHVEEAIAYFRRAIALHGDESGFHLKLGNALKKAGKTDKAIAAYRQAIALNPSYAEAHNNLGNTLKDMGQIDESIMAFRQALALAPNLTEAYSNLLFGLHCSSNYDAQAIAEEHRYWNRQHAEPLKKYIQPHVNDRKPERRLRIGYVSPDFLMHSVGEFLLPLLAHHDKNQVEVFCYAHVPVPDAMTERLRACSDGWRSIVGLSEVQAADLIREDRIDILVDLAMHTANNRLLVFARKPAPVQATYLAYCSTTGLETIDYRLSDPYLDPLRMDESVYSEQTIRLPETYWCYQPSIASAEVNPLPALTQVFLTFGCLNNFCKVSEATLAAWSKLLRVVPNAQLLLHAREGSHRLRVQERLTREGVQPKRVQFVDSVPLLEYFRLHHRVDIALDTFPYGGGTTTCDALWMGVPVVSLVGKTAVGRGGLSILSNIGLPELVARSEDDYVRIATELATDLPRLSNLRSTLRQRMQQSSLMDAPRFARNMEAAYRQMWRKWCGALAPR